MDTRVIGYFRRAKWLQAVALAVVMSLLVGCAGAAAPSGGTSTLVPLEIPMNDLPLAGSPVIGGVGSSLVEAEERDEDSTSASKVANDFENFTLADMESCVGDDTSECPFTAESSQGYCLAASQFGSLASATGNADLDLCMVRTMLAESGDLADWGDGVSRHIELNITDVESLGNATINDGELASAFVDEWIESLWLDMLITDEVIVSADMRVCSDNEQVEYFKHTIGDDNEYELIQKYVNDDGWQYVEVQSTLDSNGNYTGEKAIELQSVLQNGALRTIGDFTEDADSILMDTAIYLNEGVANDYSIMRQYVAAELTDTNDDRSSNEGYDRSKQGIGDGSDNYRFDKYTNNVYLGAALDRDTWDAASTNSTSDTSLVPEPRDGDPSLTISFTADESADCTESYDEVLTVSALDMLSYYNSCSGFTIEESNINCSTLVPDESREYDEDDAIVQEVEEEFEVSSVVIVESGNSSNTATLTTSSSSPVSFDSDLAQITVTFESAYEVDNMQANENVYLETYPAGTKITMATEQPSDASVKLITSSTPLESGQVYRVVIVGSDDLDGNSPSVSADGNQGLRVVTTKYYYVSIE